MKFKKNKRIERDNLILIFPIIMIVGMISFLMISATPKTNNFDWSGIRKNIKDSISKYEYCSITSGIGGNGIAIPDEIESRQWIMKNATTSELRKLLEYPHGNIRAISYEGLIQKSDYKNKVELILKSLDDNNYPVYYSNGCLGTQIKISEYLIEYVLMIDDSTPPFRPELIKDYGISDADKLMILDKYHKKQY